MESGAFVSSSFGLRRAVCGVGLLLLATGSLLGAEWPAWRGPDGNGTSSATGLASDWEVGGSGELWRADWIGRSTPVVFDGRVCATGRIGEGQHKQETVACWDAFSGKKLWQDKFNVYNTTVPFNRVGWASPVADPETGYLYVHGVAGQLRCYDRRGKIVWDRFLAEEVGRLSGYGGRTQTPLIDGDQLILSFVSANWGKHAAPRHRYFSFDKRTGEIRWISTPGNFPYDMNTQSVPLVAEIAGRRMLVSGNADGFIYALDPENGRELWRFELSRRGINASVVVDDERVYASHSEENVDDPLMGRFVAIDATGSGDVTKTHERWRIAELAAGFPSPALHKGKLYVVDNSANLYKIDAKSGKVEWEYALGTVGKASPVVADGKIYVPETNGRFHILLDGQIAPRSLSLHELESEGGRYAEIYGSPAVGYGRVYVATEGKLYCIGKPGAEEQAADRPKRSKKKRRSRERPSAGSPSTLQVRPTELLLEPGDRARFEVVAFDASGRQAELGEVQWQLEGLAGTLKNGRFVADPDTPFQAGEVVVKSGALSASARLRVVAPLPWEVDFDEMEPGSVPAHWVGAKGKYVVQDREGERVLTKTFRERGLLRNALYLGPSTMSGYTIEVDVLGARKKRRRTDAGVINSGYTFDLMGNHQRVQIRTWPSEERIASEVDFSWDEGVWYRLKLRVEQVDGKALVQGKVWPRAEREPGAWTITVEDPHPIAAGAPGLLGYSPADTYYDNLVVTVN